MVYSVAKDGDGALLSKRTGSLIAFYRLLSLFFIIFLCDLNFNGW